MEKHAEPVDSDAAIGRRFYEKLCPERGIDEIADDGLGDSASSGTRNSGLPSIPREEVFTTVVAPSSILLA